MKDHTSTQFPWASWDLYFPATEKKFFKGFLILENHVLGVQDATHSYMDCKSHTSYNEFTFPMLATF